MIWLEAALSLAAIALVAIACWREGKLVAWEDKYLRRERIKQRKEADHHGKEKA